MREVNKDDRVTAFALWKKIHTLFEKEKEILSKNFIEIIETSDYYRSLPVNICPYIILNSVIWQDYAITEEFDATNGHYYCIDSLINNTDIYMGQRIGQIYTTKMQIVDRAHFMRFTLELE